MKKIYFSILFSALIFSSACLNRDNLAPYQTTLSKNKAGSSMIKTERKKIELLASKLKETSDSSKELYVDMSQKFANWLKELQISFKQENIKRSSYQDAISVYEDAYKKFISYASENLENKEIENMDLSEDTYHMEIAAKRMFNFYRTANDEKRKKLHDDIATYNFSSFDKL